MGEWDDESGLRSESGSEVWAGITKVIFPGWYATTRTTEIREKHTRGHSQRHTLRQSASSLERIELVYCRVKKIKLFSSFVNLVMLSMIEGKGLYSFLASNWMSSGWVYIEEKQQICSFHAKYSGEPFQNRNVIRSGMRKLMTSFLLLLLSLADWLPNQGRDEEGYFGWK